jgi:pimeloyl-ACP methyl ester carboxylesterase
MAALNASFAGAAVESRLLSVEPCQFTAGGGTVEAQCGWIAVPETHFAATETEIQLPFVRFKSTSATPGAPIVYLAGGPGGSGIGTAKSARFHLFMKLREAADVIAFDQRGTGDAKPDLTYDAKFDFPLDQPADFAVWTPLTEKKFAECAEHFRGKGITLAYYNTKESAADVNALRQALGLEKISLWGTSYGTHLACAVVRYHGAHLDRVILSGVEGPDHTFKLPSATQAYYEELSAELATRPEIAEKIPDLVALTRRILDRLEREPVRLDWAGGKLALGPLDLQMYLSESIGRRRSIRPLPAALYLADQGDFRRIAGFVATIRRQPLGNAMSLAMDCASGGSPERRARIKHEGEQMLVGNASNFPFEDACSALGVPDLGEEFRGPLRSDVPALFISGTLDARTPIANAEEVRKGFATNYHIIVENAGHDEELFSQAPGLGDRMVAFLQGKAPSEERIRYDALEIAPIQ